MTKQNAHQIILFANTSWYLFNFRLSLIQRLRQLGFRVHCLAPDREYQGKLEAAGASFHFIELSRSGRNPFMEFAVLIELYKFLKPFDRHSTTVLTFTPKCNLYTNIVCKLTGIPVISNISGLGSSLGNQAGGLFRFSMMKLNQFAFSSCRHIFFQNAEDQETFLKAGIANESKCSRLYGSGVDLEKFQPQPLKDKPRQTTRFLFIGRLLWSKGLGLAVEAAELLGKEGFDLKIQALGFLDEANPNGIPESQITTWVKDNHLDYLGKTDDVRPHMLGADCIILPTFYFEGVPRSLIEACALGKPIITTDWPGARDTVDHGKNGYLVEPRQIADLAQAMRNFIQLSPERKQEMGQFSRQKAIDLFDQNTNINAYIDTIE